MPNKYIETQLTLPTLNRVKIFKRNYSYKTFNVLEVKNNILQIFTYDEATKKTYPIAKKNIFPTQQSTCIRFQFDRDGLNSLRETYKKVYGVPDFISNILDFQRESKAHLIAIRNHPECYLYLKKDELYNNPFLIIPNTAYYPNFSLPENNSDLKKLRLMDTGIASCAWFMHPKLDLIQQEQSKCLLDNLENGLGVDIQLNESTESAKRNSVRIEELNKHSKYYSSILDLTFTDIPMLKSLKSQMEEHLKKAYRVDLETDKVDLYFHFPYQPSTVTLHLHARVNQGSSPFEESRAFFLSDIISCLKKGKTIDDMILERQKLNGGSFYKYSSDKVEWMKDLKGVIVEKGVDNPLAIKGVDSTVQVKSHEV